MSAEVAAASAAGALLRVRNLTVRFKGAGRDLTAVDGVDLELGRGDIVGLVGESGCGKSVTMMALSLLVPASSGVVTADELSFGGVSVLDMSTQELRNLRGRDLGFIFQNPLHSLNPLLPIGIQISEGLEQHMQLSRKAATAQTVDLLARVGIPDPKRRLRDLPHQFSGGMCQRVMIAMAIACEPKLILADEPTTALDVTIQAQILELLGSIVSETGASIIFVTHDLGVAAGFCNHIHVMYAGQIVESAPVDAVFYEPRTPYTWGLLNSVARFDQEAPETLPFIRGRPPNPHEFGTHCRFRARCDYARQACAGPGPDLLPRPGRQHLARCFGTEPSGWLEARS